jgi:hypothetical protein
MLEGPVGCSNPSTYIGESTGFVSCDGGFIHRVAKGTCPLHPPTSEITHPGLSPCQSDSDCAMIARGHCIYRPSLGLQGCESECAADGDCESGQVCLCDSEFNRCIATNCATDADCASGRLCASYANVCSPSFVGGFACQIADDACTTNAACVGSEYAASVCRPSGGARQCLGAGACGGA